MQNLSKVKITPYDPNWPKIFVLEANRVRNQMIDSVKFIYHIGSTAIPNMSAKPIINILIVFEDFDKIEEIKEKLQILNYPSLSRQVTPHVSFFTSRRETNIGFNLHLYEKSSPQILRHVNFRNYLIGHPIEAKKYADLKVELANKFSENLESYVTGKNTLVQEIDRKAKLWVQKKKNATSWSLEKIMKWMVVNLNIHMTHFAQYINEVEFIRLPGFTIVNSGLLDDTFNYVLDADFSDDQADEKISYILNYFKNKKVPFSWWVSPLELPINLEEHLLRHSFYHSENNQAMYFDLEAWDGLGSVHSELKIIQALDEKTLHDFALVLSNDENTFKTYFSWIASIITQEDPIEYYVGYIDNKPVVRGLSCYSGEVVGLHWLSTAPEERRKGYGESMQYFRLKRAKERRYRFAVLQASKEGYPLYKKLGYQDCGVFKEYKLK